MIAADYDQLKQKLESAPKPDADPSSWIVPDQDKRNGPLRFSVIPKRSVSVYT